MKINRISSILVLIGLLWSVATAELVLYYDFEGDTTDVVTDKSGNGINGILREFNVNGQTLYQNTGAGGSRCLVTNSIMSTTSNQGRSVTYMPAGFTFAQEATFTFWVKRYYTLEAMEGAEGNSTAMGWYDPARTLFRGFYARNSVHAPTGAPVDSVFLFEYDDWIRYPNIMLPADGKWHFVAVRFSATLGLQVRVDDSVSINAADKRSIGDCSIVMLGNRLDRFYPFFGEFDEVKVFKGIMPDVEIERMYTLGRKADAPMPSDTETNVAPSVSTISWAAPNTFNGGALTCNVYFGETPNLGGTPSITNSTNTSAAVTLAPNKNYYWRVDYYDAGIGETLTGNVWQFYTVSDKAVYPLPADGGEVVPSVNTLSWSAAVNAASYIVYISEDQAGVADRTISGMPTLQESISLDGYQIKPIRTYYWAVDTITAGGATVLGDVWMFNTTGLSTSIEGDLNYDGRVDLADFSELASQWQATTIFPAEAAE